MSNRNNNNFYITDFDESLDDLVLEFAEEVEKQAALADGKITIWINSYGGYLSTLVAFLELIEIAKSRGIIIRTVVLDVAFSCGSMLAVAGSPGERYIGKSAEHLIHQGTIGSVESTQLQVERFTAWKKRNFKRVIDHYKKYANVPNLDNEILDNGWFITSKDCLKYSLADKYTEKLAI